MLIRYVNTASTVGTQDGTTNTAGSSGTAAFATLRQAIDAIGASLSDAMTIYCSGGEDTGDVNQTPWDFATTATNYLLITATGNQRFNGVWSESKYYLHSTNRNGLYNNIPSHLRIDGIQVKLTVTDANQYVGIKTTNLNQTETDIDCRITNCAVKSSDSTKNTIAFNTRYPDAGASGTSVVANCVAIDCRYGYNSDFDGAVYYNCGSYDCQYGFVEDAGNMICKNCISYSSDIGFIGTFASGSADNAEDDGNGAPGTGSASAVMFTFTNAASDDFSLAVGDTGAKDQGTDLSADGTYAFSTDVTGGTRTGTWDRGPFEYGATSGSIVPHAMAHYRMRAA